MVLMCASDRPHAPSVIPETGGRGECVVTINMADMDEMDHWHLVFTVLDLSSGYVA